LSTIDVLSFRDRDGWRSWLAENYSDKDEVWVYILRKGSKGAGLRLEEAVDEAVCFGWIDSKMKSLNGDKFILRFCKRKPKSVWSKINRCRVERMIRSGRMTKVGLVSVEEAKRTGMWDKAYTSKVSPVIPGDLEEALRLNSPAIEIFMRLPNSAKLQLIVWVKGAKRSETRKKRINECIRKVITQQMLNRII
jgi:uncharacterized protein YdeI (YjbR/CyaY-like superfamily)